MRKLLLLLGKKDILLLEEGKEYNTSFGKVDLRNVKIGDVVETKRERFVVVKPTLSDLMRKCRRGAQIVMPKDASQIVAITGLGQGWRCMDAGSGSGFLAIFLGNLVGGKGRVYTYEIRKDFYEIAKKNIEMCGMEKVVKIKNEDVRNFRERNLDLVTLDMKNAHEMVGKAKKRLKPGGWIAIYSPHIEEQIRAREEMEKEGMKIYATVETIQRLWKSRYGYTHPEPSGILHTGFITVGRKLMDS